MCNTHGLTQGQCVMNLRSSCEGGPVLYQDLAAALVLDTRCVHFILSVSSPHATPDSSIESHLKHLSSDADSVVTAVFSLCKLFCSHRTRTTLQNKDFW